MTTQKAIVVGAGINGVVAAIELRKRGHEVALVDPGPLPHPLAASTDISKAVRAAYGGDEDYTALAEQSRIVRVPLNRAGTLHRIGKRASSLLQELGRQPTNLEIADGMDITEDEVAKTMMISQVHLSLDAPMTPGEDNRLLDYLADNVSAWVLQADGAYCRLTPAPDAMPHSAQSALLAKLCSGTNP